MAYTGLKNFYYAKLTSDDDTAAVYEAPKKMGNAISFNETSATNTATLFAENGPVATGISYGATTLELSVDKLTLITQADLFGQTINADGVLVQSRNDKAPYVAIGAQLTGEDEDDAFVWLYKGKFSRPNTTANTKGDSVTFQSPVISAAFIDRDFDGQNKVVVYQDPATQAITDAWFTSVYELVVI